MRKMLLRAHVLMLTMYYMEKSEDFFQFFQLKNWEIWGNTGKKTAYEIFLSEKNLALKTFYSFHMYSIKMSENYHPFF